MFGVSEPTAEALASARVALARAITFARIEQRRCLEATAAALPTQLAAIAQAELELEDDTGSLSQPLRAARDAELGAATAAVAADIRAGIDEVRWPAHEDGFDVISTLDAAVAVYGFLAARVRPLEALVLLHAHRGRDTSTVRRLLSPRPFFDPRAFTVLAGLLNRVAAAEIAVENAERDHHIAMRRT